MTEQTPMSRRQEWLEFWEQRELTFLRTLPFPLLALCALFDVVLQRQRLDANAWIDLALVAASAAALVAAARLDRSDCWEKPRPPRVRVGTVVFAVLVGLAAALVLRQPLYGFYAWSGYVWGWRLLRGNWRFLGLGAVAMVVAVSQTGGGSYNSASAIIALILVYLVNLCIASAFTWFGWIGTEQQQRRQRELSALTEANAKLEQSLRRNAELQEELLGQAREAAVAEERRRMAREIHDTLAQGLMGIITQLQAAQRTGVGSRAHTRHLTSAIDLARDSLSEARRSVHALAPEPLAGARLPDAINDVASRWAELHEVPVAFTTTGAARVMRPEIEVALLRTAQEALANVARHAHASRVGLTLCYMEDLITLDVRDDGVGFATVNGTGPRRPRQDSGGFGLDAMRQRVEGVGGTLEIESEPDGGTAISAAVPAIAVGDPS